MLTIICQNMNIIKAALLLSIITLISCSPTKGYPGPELPENKIATVYVTSDNKNLEVYRCSTSGQEFNTSGITLLPGEHRFDLAIAILGSPYDCQENTKFDSSGYRSCLDDQDRARRKNKSPTACYESTYTKTYYGCFRKYLYANCSLSDNLEANTKYELNSSSSIYTNPPALYLEKIKKNEKVNEILKRTECVMTGEDTKYEELDHPY